jgi:FKBP-type peptidyl-prolyl cis-trans isomerase
MRYSVIIPTVFSCCVLAIAATACGSDDKSDSKPAVQPTPVAGAANVAPGGTPAVTSSNASNAQFDKSKATTNPSGLMYIDTVEGTGESPKIDQTVVVHYTGKLASDGKVFDSSVTRGQPATFPLRGVIKGFSEGILTMKPGGKRTVLIPAAMAYGANPPAGSGIPANADLIFEIELISFK